MCKIRKYLKIHKTYLNWFIHWIFFLYFQATQNVLDMLFGSSDPERLLDLIFTSANGAIDTSVSGLRSVIINVVNVSWSKTMNLEHLDADALLSQWFRISQPQQGQHLSWRNCRNVVNVTSDKQMNLNYQSAFGIVRNRCHDVFIQSLIKSSHWYTIYSNP